MVDLMTVIYKLSRCLEGIKAASALWNDWTLCCVSAVKRLGPWPLSNPVYRNFMRSKCFQDHNNIVQLIAYKLNPGVEM
jgi:hypothetical protein